MSATSPAATPAKASSPVRDLTTFQAMLIWDGRYRIERTLGEGGMGQVFLARDLAAGERRVAIKLLLPEFADATSEFMREYVLQRRVSHPSVPRVWDFGFGQHPMGEVPYFAMDYVRGVPLARAIFDIDRPARAWPWIMDTLRALDHLHGLGYLHRDLKPGNILVDMRRGDDVRGHAQSAHLIDFGIAIAMDAEPEEMFLGTPEYSAPELMVGDPFDPRQDLYAIGLLLYELIARRRPWDQEDPNELWELRTYGAPPPLPKHPDCGPKLRALIDDLLAPAPEARPASAAEVLVRFAEAIGEAPATLETAEAFRLRLDGLVCPEQGAIERIASEWHGGARARVDGGDKRPGILVIDAPRGHDGRALVHELADRGAIGGARVLRLRLTPRAHGPLEAIAPALGVLRRLRAQRNPDGVPELPGLAGAATMLTRLHGSTLLCVEDLQRADAATLHVLSAAFGGAANAALRVVATVDPSEPPAAPDALDALVGSEHARSVALEPLTPPTLGAWLGDVLGAAAPGARYAEDLYARSGGVPAQVRAAMVADHAAGRLVRGRDGFALSGGGPVRRLDAATARADPGLNATLACLNDPLPEHAVAELIGTHRDLLPYLIADGTFDRLTDGRLALRAGVEHGVHRDELGAEQIRVAEVISASPRFAGQAVAAANAWLQSSQPTRAIPHLIAAANDGAEHMRLDDATHHLARARDLLAAHARTIASARASRWRSDIAVATVNVARQTRSFEGWEAAASELFERGLEAGRVPAMRDALEALVELSVARGAWDDARRHLASREALSNAQRVEGEAIARWVDAEAIRAEGRPRAALDALRHDARDAGRLRPSWARRLLATEAAILVDAGWARDAEPVIARYRRRAAQSGRLAERAHATLLLARNLRQTHDVPDAMRILTDLGGLLGDRVVPGVDGQLERELAHLNLALGRRQFALDHARRARALSEADGDRPGALEALVVEGEALAALDRHRAADALFDSLARSLEPTDSALMWLTIRLVRLRLARVLGGLEPGATVQELNVLIGEAHELGARALTIRAWAEATRARVDPGAKADAAQRALDLSAQWDGVGAPPYELMHELAAARAAAGHTREASALLAVAERELEARGRALETPEARAAWAALPIHEAIAVTKRALANPGDGGASGPATDRHSRAIGV